MAALVYKSSTRQTFAPASDAARKWIEKYENMNRRASLVAFLAAAAFGMFTASLAFESEPLIGAAIVVCWAAYRGWVGPLWKETDRLRNEFDRLSDQFVQMPLPKDWRATIILT